MLELFKKKKSPSYEEILEIFLTQFYSNEAHSWIIQDRYIRANFDDFFEKLPADVLKKFIGNQKLIFVLSIGFYINTLDSMSHYVIIVFPELFRLLKSSATNHALAILAHEIGHIVCGHSRKIIDPIKAQVEADRFACELGYAPELDSFLFDQNDSIEKKIRMTYVTSYMMKDYKRA